MSNLLNVSIYDTLSPPSECRPEFIEYLYQNGNHYDVIINIDDFNPVVNEFLTKIGGYRLQEDLFEGEITVPKGCNQKLLLYNFWMSRAESDLTLKVTQDDIDKFIKAQATGLETYSESRKRSNLENILHHEPIKKQKILDERDYWVFRQEGVKLDDYLTVSRDRKIAEIFAQLETNSIQHVCLIRAPPFCGKTSLKLLMQEYCRKNELDFHGYSFFQKEPFDFELFKGDYLRKTYIVIDEVQASYEGNLEFWKILKTFASQPHPNLYFILFASYGPQALGKASPYTPEFILGLRDICFSSYEMNELYDKFQTNTKIIISAEVRRGINDYMLRHPGLTVLFLQTCRIKFIGTAFKHFNEPVTSEVLLSYLVSDFTDDLERGSCRAMPQYDNNYFSSFTSVMNRLLKYNQISDTDPDIQDSLKALERGGVIIHHRRHYMFPSPMAKSVYLRRFFRQNDEHVEGFRNDLLKDGISTDWKDYSIYQFIEVVLSRIDSKKIENTFSYGKEKKPLESFYQLEFYRYSIPLCQVLRISDCHVEIGRAFDSVGRFDFYVNHSLQWGIEMVRDNDGIEAQLNRFETYYKLIPLKGWVLLHFVYKVDANVAYPQLHEHEVQIRVDAWKRSGFETFTMVYLDSNNKQVSKKVNFFSKVQKSEI